MLAYMNPVHSIVDERIVLRRDVRKQDVGGAHLDDTPRTHHDHAVRVGHGFESVRDGDDGQVRELASDRLLQDDVRLLVDRRRRFVDAQHLNEIKFEKCREYMYIYIYM